MDQKPFVVKSHDVHPDAEYSKWLRDVKERFRKAQIKSTVKVNSEMLLFNWQLGRDLVTKKAEEKWGSGIVEQMSLDLQDEFPKVKGFSTTNLWYMKKWYLFYAASESAEEISEAVIALWRELNQHPQKLQQVVGEIAGEEKLHQPGGEIVGNEKLQQVVGEMEFPPAFSYVPWGHHIQIITKCKTVSEALFYIQHVIEEGWSRSALADNIAADLYHHAGAAVTNFAQTLPSVHGSLAQSILKDTYDFSFVSLPPGYKEEELENVLEQNITRFLLELGMGFSFVGRQKEIVVAGKTRKIDMLFYHIRFKCYVVVELKVTSFEPEYAGKLNFYVNAVNELIKTEDENPTIGLLICKDANGTEVQWALQGIQTPIGVAAYKGIREEELRAALPTAEQIQNRIEQAENEYRESLLNKNSTDNVT